MTALLVAATVVVVLGLVGVLAVYLWVTGTMVDHMAAVLSEQVAPGAREVAGHVGGMSVAIRQLDAALGELA